MKRSPLVVVFWFKGKLKLSSIKVLRWTLRLPLQVVGGLAAELHANLFALANSPAQKQRICIPRLVKAEGPKFGGSNSLIFCVPVLILWENLKTPKTHTHTQTDHHRREPSSGAIGQFVSIVYCSNIASGYYCFIDLFTHYHAIFEFPPPHFRAFIKVLN